MTLPLAAIEVCRGVLTPAGLRAALDLATPFDHDAAVRVGFLDEVVPEPDLATRAREVAERAAGLDEVAHRRTTLRTRAALLDALRTAIDADRAELDALIAATG